jgi:hypothetical protein
MVWRCRLASECDRGPALGTAESVSTRNRCDLRKRESPLWRRDTLNFECDDIGKRALDDEKIGLPTASATSLFRPKESLQGTDHTESENLLTVRPRSTRRTSLTMVKDELRCRVQDGEGGGTRENAGRVQCSSDGFS